MLWMLLLLLLFCSHPWLSTGWLANHSKRRQRQRRRRTVEPRWAISFHAIPTPASSEAADIARRASLPGVSRRLAYLFDGCATGRQAASQQQASQRTRQAASNQACGRLGSRRATTIAITSSSLLINNSGNEGERCYGQASATAIVVSGRRTTTTTVAETL